MEKEANDELYIIMKKCVIVILCLLSFMYAGVFFVHWSDTKYTIAEKSLVQIRGDMAKDDITIVRAAYTKRFSRVLQEQLKAIREDADTKQRNAHFHLIELERQRDETLNALNN